MAGHGTPTHELRLVEDSLPDGARFALPADGVNRVLHVVNGGITVDGTAFAADSAWHGRGAATVEAGPEGATIWRFELVSPGAAPAMAGEGRSTVKMTAPIALPGTELLMRNDSVAFPPGGCAFLHTHQGPGIRCLVEGAIRIDTEGRSTSYGPGSPWFEAGPEPVFAQAAADRPSRFVRVMVLPAALLGRSSIAYVNAEDREKPKSQRYQGYVDAAISL